MSELRANQSLTSAQAEELARLWLAEAIEEEDRILASYRPNDPKDRQRAVERTEKMLEGAHLLAFEVHDVGLAADDAIELLTRVGISEPSREAVDLVADLLLRANVEVQSRTVAKLKGNVWKGVKDPVFEEREVPPGPFNPLTAQQATIAPATPIRTIAELSGEYLEREIAVRTGLKNVQKATAHLRTFSEILGPDRSVLSLTRNDLSDFRAVLEHLPANVSKLFPNQPLRKVAKVNHKKRVLSSTSINQFLIRVGAFLTWCRDHGHIEADLSTTRLKVRKSSRAKESRTPFQKDELEALFTGPLYSGCKSRSRRNDPGALVIRDGTYFLPLLGLLTGARLGELVGLTPEDVVGEAGRRVILIRPNKLRELKNAVSVRSVPLHPALEELGFGKFLEGRTALKQSIFGDMAKARGGNISNNASRWFSLHLDKIGIKRPGLSFHSFRHLFEDLTRVSDVSEDLRRALKGQTQNGMGSVYGGFDEGFTIDQRREAIEKLQLPIDLMGLPDLANLPGKRLVTA